MIMTVLDPIKLTAPPTFLARLLKKTFEPFQAS